MSDIPLNDSVIRPNVFHYAPEANSNWVFYETERICTDTGNIMYDIWLVRWTDVRTSRTYLVIRFYSEREER